jgi:hypothetical protein
MNKGIYLGLFALIFGSTLAKADNLFVVNRANSTIERFDPSGVGVIFSYVIGLNPPTGIALDKGGNLYVCSDTWIVKYNSNGVRSVFGGGTLAHYGLAVDSFGNLYVANFNGTIEKFTPDGVRSLFASSGALGYFSLACDSSDNVYAGNIVDGTVVKYDSRGASSIFASGLNNPRGLAFDRNDNLYVANAGSGRIMKFDPSGVGSIFALSSSLPQGLACDSGGNLYVSYYSTITKYDSAGSGSLFAYDFSGPSFMAIQLIPEPSACVMMTLGFGALLGGCPSKMRRLTKQR